MCVFPSVRGAKRPGSLLVDLTGSLDPRRTSAICAFETFEATSRIDVKLPLQIATGHPRVGRGLAAIHVLATGVTPRHAPSIGIAQKMILAV